MKSIVTTKEVIYCKSCFKEISLKSLRYLIEKKPLLCDDCISNISTKLEERNINGTKILFLSSYSGLMKQWLMNFKELGDVELAPCFLYLFLPIIKLKYPGYVFVPLPSSEKRIQKRGFDHLSLILQAFHLPFSNLLLKEDNEEQKNLNGPERFKKKGIALINRQTDFSGKKIILFDDVYTTGSTFRESLAEVQKLHPLKVKGLILMDNFHLDSLKML